MPITVRKAVRDLLRRRLRSLLTVIGIVVGVAGIVAIITTSRNLAAAQTAAYNNASQQDQSWSATGVSAGLIAAVRAHPNVAAADRRADYTTKWSAGEAWRDAYFLGLEDFADQQVNKVTLIEGRWPARGEVVFETSIRQVVPLQVGQDVTYRSGPAGETRQLRVSGFARSPAYPAASIIGTAIAYLPAADVRHMYGGDGDSLILVRLKDFSAAATTRKDLELLFARSNLPFGGYRQRNPDNYPGKQGLDALILLMGIFSGVGLLISGFLVANTLAAVIGEQMSEIGAMKAVGATSGRILRLYLVAGLLYGLAGSAAGLVLGVGGSFALISYLATLLNLDLSGFAPDPLALLAGLAIGLGVTLLAALLPAWRGTTLSVRAALGSYGISATYGQGLVDRLLRRVGWLPRVPAMALRNLGRRKARNLVTVLVVACSAAALLAAQSTSYSLDQSINAWFDIYDIDAFVWFQHPVTPGFAATLRSIPTVTGVDAWANTGATIADTRTVLWGMPGDTQLYRYHLVAGRWFRPDEYSAAVLAVPLAARRGYQVGDRFPISVGSAETWLDVVGIVADNINNLGSTAVGKVFVPLPTAQRLLHTRDEADFFVIRLADHSPAAVDATLATVERKYRTLQPGSETWYQNRQDAMNQTDILAKLLYAMVLIVGAIGALGIANTLTLNVLERRREIGVLRAIGAGNRHLVQIFLTEAFALGAGGYLLGLLLGYPLARLLVWALGQVLFQINFYFPGASVLWAGLFTLALTTVASVGPALGAARLHVSETLRYE